MSTNYSPDGNPLPLALGNFGTTQSTIDPATRTPTMAESQMYSWSEHGKPFMNPVYGGPTTPQGWNPHPSTRGGGVSLNYDYNAPVPVGAGPLWSRYQSVQANPAALTADPAYQFLFNQGQEALNRTAAAKRMRFAGKTMLDAQNFGQGLAASNFRTMLGELRAGAQDEYGRDVRNAQANALANANKLMASDPYGHLRSAMNFRNPFEYAASLGAAGQDPRAYSTLESRWTAGQNLKRQMGL